MYEKLKTFLLDDALFLAILLVFVAIASFALGRVSVAHLANSASSSNGYEAESKIKYIQTPSVAGEVETISDTDTTVTTTDNFYVASKNGTKYHLPTCPGAKQIVEANKIFFADKDLAAAAGYAPASNCKGI